MSAPTPPPAFSGDPTAAPAPKPTTYVQTDATTFKELVQRLTGPHDDLPSSTPIPKLAGVRRPTFKLHERRQASRFKLAVLKPIVSPQPPGTELGFYSPGGHSPVISPSTQLSVLSISDRSDSPAAAAAAAAAGAAKLNEEEEEKAIRERRFYLHPSPRSGIRSVEPELLTLFPLSSPSTK